MVRYNRARKALIFWCLFIGIGALVGSTGMLCDPTGKAMGMDKMLPYFKVLPFSKYLFQNYTFSGISLLIVNGITNITAAILLIKKKKLGIYLGGLFGITLMLWIIIQFIIFPMNFMSTTYFIFGALQALTGYICYVFYTQSIFKVDDSIYTNIGTNKKELVVYFSRMGYTKKVALEEANKRGAEVIELITKEHTKGTSGFWWCGRYGMMNMPMPIEDVNKDLTKYDKVIIVSPIWVFKISAPVLDFCNKYTGKIKSSEYILIHFMRASFKGEADKMDNILKIKRDKFISICSRIGKIINVKEY